MKPSQSFQVTRAKIKLSMIQPHRIFDRALAVSSRSPLGRDISINPHKLFRMTNNHRAVDTHTLTLVPPLHRLTARPHLPLHADKIRGRLCPLLPQVFRVLNLVGHAARARKLLSHNRRYLHPNLDKHLHPIEVTRSLIRA